ncbi:SEC-C metal-binding domain-containing protein [Mucilaginibacter pocheonensis]
MCFCGSKEKYRRCHRDAPTIGSNLIFAIHPG